ALLEADRGLGAHVDRLLANLGLVLGRADFDAEGAASAVLRCDLNGVLPAFRKILAARINGLEGRRRLGQMLGIVGFLTDGRVRTNHGALAALDADLRIPDRDLQGDITLLVLR